jgi:hypothetical protein
MGINIVVRMCGFVDVQCNRAKNYNTISHISKKEKT